MLDEKDMAVIEPSIAPRDEDGALREDFVERVRDARQRRRRGLLSRPWSATCTRPMSAP